MKWVFLALTLCGLVAINQAKNYHKNAACLVNNKYRHESFCHGPSRNFYAFHRVLLNCIRVITKCPQFHRKNEYPSLERCQNDCAYHMRIKGAKATPKDAPSEGNTTTTAPDDGDTTTPAPGGNGGAAGGGNGEATPGKAVSQGFVSGQNQGNAISGEEGDGPPLGQALQV